MDEGKQLVQGSKRRILIVEDDVASGNALQSFLAETGYETILVTDGEQAVRAAREQRLDMVLTDLGLPRLDGYGVIDALHAKQPQIPIIVMTGTGEIASAVRAMRAGAENYLQKPLDLDVLALAIERAFERARLRGECETFFALSLDMLAVAGFDGYLKRVNAAWEKALGWTAAELVAQPWLHFVHPDDRDATIEAGRKLTEGVNVTTFTNRYRCRNGSYRWLRRRARRHGREAARRSSRASA
jgi:PAS domain S-box-containing protein